MSFNLFKTSSHAQAYTKYRPVYIDDIFDWINGYCSEQGASGFDLAVDIACGDGRSAIPLKKYFKKVIGLDVSYTQIEEAKTKVSQDDNVQFRVGQAENLEFLKDSSVDLITVAMAIHWVDTGKLDEEVRRVLKPGGSLIVYDYDDQILDNEEAEKYVSEVSSNIIEPGSNLPKERIRYRAKDYQNPFEGVERRQEFNLQHHWSINEFMNYYLTVSWVATFMRLQPDTKVFHQMKQKLRDIYGGDEAYEERVLTATFPGRMMLCRKPQNYKQ